MIQHLFHLSTDKPVTLQQQVYESISNGILDGHISPDIPLPSTRQLSKMLAISRNTVVIAYQNLTADGYLLPKDRAGFYVDKNILKGKPGNTQPLDITANSQPDWESLVSFNRVTNTIKRAQNWQEQPYPFVYGQLDPDLFPFQHWRECSLDSVRILPAKNWLSDHYDSDDPLLITQIKSRLLPRRGIWAENDEILVTVGAQNAIFMTLYALLNNRSTLGVENPGYPDLYQIANQSGANIKPLAIDSQGLIINEQINTCNLLFTTPSHQFPTTVTMPLERRKQLLQKATEHDFLIIEDDYENEISFESTPLPALKSFDADNRVIYIGSLSKTLSPGLRLGYIVAPKPFINVLREIRCLMLRHPAMNNQKAVGLFLERGYYHSLVTKLVAVYKERWKIMNTSINMYLPDYLSQPLIGGSACWIEGPKHLNAKTLKSIASDHGIIIESGEKFYAGDQIPLHTFRLGYSSIKTDKIDSGILKLSNLAINI
ncbi:MocR-like pyridoxine biosynthesis transcription factor PdxR [Aliamphritea ceti]|uniref:MocR-like pyridoxine biosynthesis transcription factor PdxR n=1 Tax=Aliamphritea ceti TaxID=1524258 RepID=UPI0021C31DF3|nr:PLP-dependent aminotransferase family protein [Aliamphritea ceti]